MPPIDWTEVAAVIAGLGFVAAVVALFLNWALPKAAEFEAEED